MRILVCQITRLGDVLQTTPLLRVLRRKYPDAHITAMVRPMGLPIAERSPDLDDILLYEEEDTFRDLQSGDSDRLLKAYTRTDAYVRMLQARGFDVAYNCAHSVVSAALLTMAGIPRIVGAGYSADWRFVIRGAWTNYFFTGVFTREFNDLNLCDVSQRYEPQSGERTGLVLELHDADRSQARAILREHGIGDDDFLVCIQLGASDDNKRWSAANFAALAERLSKQRNARIALIGVQSESRYGERFEQLAPGLAVHLFGKTSVGELSAVLERANLLITNDTGTMHVAAAVQCPIVLVSVGYVHFRETGPYAEGCVAVEKKRGFLKPSEWAAHETDERDQAHPDQVAAAVDYVLSHARGGVPEQWGPGPAWEDCHLYVSRFAADGCLAWHPLVRRAPEEGDVLRLAYRAMWLDHFEGGADAAKEAAALRESLLYFDTAGDTVAQIVDGLVPSFDELERMANEGRALTEQIPEALERRDFSLAQDLARQLVRLDERIRVFGELHRGTRPIVVLARFGRDNLEGADPLIVAQGALQLYDDTASRARLMGEKLRRIAAVVMETRS